MNIPQGKDAVSVVIVGGDGAQVSRQGARG